MRFQTGQEKKEALADADLQPNTDLPKALKGLPEKKEALADADLQPNTDLPKALKGLPDFG